MNAREKRQAHEKNAANRKARYTKRRTKICKLYKSGLTYRNISLETGLSFGGIEAVVRDAGLMNRRPTRIGKKRYKFSDADKEQIFEWYARGDDISKIAKTFNSTSGSIRFLAHINKVRRPGYGASA